jgi:hypothetical protein
VRSCRGGGLGFAFSSLPTPPFSLAFLLVLVRIFLCFFPFCAASPVVTVLFYRRSILLRQPCYCSGLLASFPFWPFTARRSSSSMNQPGSTLVLRWVLINLRSTYLRSTRAYTHHPTVTIDLSALHRRLAIRRLHCTCRDVSSTRLSVDLTHRRVSPTLRTAASSSHLHHCHDQLFGLLLDLCLYLCLCVFMYFCVVFCWFYFSVVLYGL